MVKEKQKKYVSQYYVPRSPKDDTLVFESRFESGNLSLAVKVPDTERANKAVAEYNLVLQNDINTRGHTQCK